MICVHSATGALVNSGADGMSRCLLGLRRSGLCTGHSRSAAPT